MKFAIKLSLTIGAIVLLAAPTYAIDAFGSSLGSMQTAASPGMGSASFTAGLGLADNGTSILGSFGYGLSKYTDGHLKLGIIDYDYVDDLKFSLGADIKWQFWSVSDVTPKALDMAIGGIFEYQDPGGGSILHFGGALFGSYPFALKNGQAISPYGRFALRVEHISPDGPGDSESKLRFGLNSGIEWRFSSTVRAFGEFQLDGNDGIFFGIDFGLM